MARAGVIRGTVSTSASKLVGATAAYPGSAAAMPGMHAIAHGLVTDAVVYLEQVPPGVDSAITQPAPHPQLAQKDELFVPRVLPVAIGTAVDFPNKDPIYHNVFSLSPARRFDLGKYPRGQFKTVVFDRAGLVNVYCDIHSDMEAFVLVLPNHVFVRPGSDGRFTLPEVPAGRYQIRIWHPDRPAWSRSIDVPDHGDVVLTVAL